jgi:hypothetical protein
MALDEVTTVSPRESSVRISIVVPHLGDVVAFEESLVSVLENRPEGAEVLVAHDGSYHDPFDLGDEVRFVTAASSDLPTLLSAAADRATGRFLHIIGNGVRATHDWTADAIERFSGENVAMVAPVVRLAVEGRVTAAGWSDSSTDIIAPIGRGAKVISRRQSGTVRGVYLLASFWRLQEFRSAIRALKCDDAVAAEFAWSRLLTAAGWRCEIATESTMVGSPDSLLHGHGFHRGFTLRSLAAEIDERSVAGSVAAATAANVLLPSRLISVARWADTAGQAMAMVREAACVRSIRYDQIRSPQDSVATLPMSVPAAQMQTFRRAA